MSVMAQVPAMATMATCVCRAPKTVSWPPSGPSAALSAEQSRRSRVFAGFASPFSPLRRPHSVRAEPRSTLLSA